MGYYKENYRKYIEKTKNANMNEQYLFFLKYLKPNAQILDVGFGSARDMIYFKKQGYNVSGIDSNKEFLTEAIKLGLDVALLDYHLMDYKNKYDGLWCCASLLHSSDLTLAFNKCYDALSYNGFLYASFKYGDFEGVIEGRYFKHITEESLVNVLKDTQFKITEINISSDVISKRKENKWINVILSK